MSVRIHQYVHSNILALYGIAENGELLNLDFFWYINSLNTVINVLFKLCIICCN